MGSNNLCIWQLIFFLWLLRFILFSLVFLIFFRLFEIFTSLKSLVNFLNFSVLFLLFIKGLSSHISVLKSLVRHVTFLFKSKFSVFFWLVCKIFFYPFDHLIIFFDSSHMSAGLRLRHHLTLKKRQIVLKLIRWNFYFTTSFELFNVVS